MVVDKSWRGWGVWSQSFMRC